MQVKQILMQLSGAKRRVISEVTGEQQKSDRELKKHVTDHWRVLRSSPD